MACKTNGLATAGQSMRLNSGSRGFRLLTPGNPKTEKGRGAGFWTFILHLAPASLSGFNVCPMSTGPCREACLNTAGRGGIAAGGLLTYAAVQAGKRNEIQSARITRTRAFFEHRAAFMAVLVKEIGKAIRMAERDGFTPVFRLNGTSDIRWETIPVDGFPNVFAMFSNVTFYDYTKIQNRKNLPPNYHLTFSLADGNDAAARAAYDRGLNVAAVFRDKATVARYTASGFALNGGNLVAVENGDETDLRFLDVQGAVIALYAKGNAKRDRSGFVRD